MDTRLTPMPSFAFASMAAAIALFLSLSTPARFTSWTSDKRIAFAMASVSSMCLEEDPQEIVEEEEEDDDDVDEAREGFIFCFLEERV